MFKWTCFATATVLLSALTWMVNDVRLKARDSIDRVERISATVTKHIPALVERTEKTTALLAENIPALLGKARASVEMVVRVADELRSVRELALGKDTGLTAYATSVLTALEGAPGKIGVLKLLSSKELQSPTPVREWVAGARLEASVLALTLRSRKDLLTGLTRNKFGASWYLEQEGKPPVLLLDWLKANHPETAKVLRGE